MAYELWFRVEACHTVWLVDCAAHLSHGRERNEAGFLTDVIVDMESVGD